METTVLIFLAIFSSHALGFDPGCSFVGGQCQYTVKLGHEGQCDGAGSAPAPSSCCQNVTAMQTDMDMLKRQMSALQEQMQDLTSQGGGAHVTNQALEALEAELNHTQTQLSDLRAQADTEIKGLREDLTNATRALMTCHAALGVAGGDVVPDSLAGDVTMTYCGFNNGSSDWCGFTKLSSGEDFSLMRKGSQSGTGPSVDHSAGSLDAGQYMGINSASIGRGHITSSSSSTTRTRTATVESTFFEPASSYCLMFYYSMNGHDVRELNVTIRIGGGTGYPLFSRSGDQGTGWHLGRVDLDREYTSHRFKIDFIATSRAYLYKSYSSSSGYLRSAMSDIAVDDVYVYNTTCSAALKCPPGAYRFTHPTTNVTSCYTVHAAPRTWAEAADVCRREGPMSSLVRVDDLAEQTFLASTIRGDNALLAVGNNGFYTSGNDQYKEHTFVWTDRGTLDTMSYTNWHANQPNNVGGHQDCLLMLYPEDNFSWGDEDCYGAHPFICEGHYD